ncbi:sensor histidine kinase [Yinghuangia soli]|uniref:histidine kinase n=1 Tax=Yinghuangia soli TaxID=2908204 RepID=A0AA41PZH2_9ACTN|nr:ATP-binding protein [Yinghuangia soli]MCF2528200.1 histidine kinase [Yinghuangia soli]
MLLRISSLRDAVRRMDTAPPAHLARAIVAVQSTTTVLAVVGVRYGGYRLTWGETFTHCVLPLLAGWAYAWCAVVAIERRRPSEAVWPLLLAAGLCTLMLLGGIRTRPTFLIGFFADWLVMGVIAHIMTDFARGDAYPRLRRALVVTGYVATGPSVVLWVVIVGAFDIPPRDLLAESDVDTITVSPDDIVFSVLPTLVSVVALTMFFLRWWTASRILRRGWTAVLLGNIGLTGVYVYTGLMVMVPALRSTYGTGIAAARVSLALWPLFLLAGMIRARAGRSVAADLAADLGHAPPPPGHLQDALARALRDPGLRLIYYRPAHGDYVDPDGRPSPLPEPGPGRSVTVLSEVGAIVHDPALDESPDLVRAVAATARLLMENERLHAEVRAQLAEVRASRARIVEAGLAARRKIERDLHDGAQQRLVTLALMLRAAQSQAARQRPESRGDGHADADAFPAALAECAAELKLAIAELRELARGIHPAVLTEAGLSAALVSLADRSVLPVEVAAVPDGRFAPGLEEAVYFVVSESLANAAKHACATGAVIAVHRGEETMTVEIADDGVGGADPCRGTGLRGLADRVEALDGTLTVHSMPGHGTRILAELPYGAASAASAASAGPAGPAGLPGPSGSAEEQPCAS